MRDAESDILQSKPGKKSLEHVFVIYADLECLLLKMNTCNNNNNHIQQQKHYISLQDTLY